VARDLFRGRSRVIAVVGDGALSGGIGIRKAVSITPGLSRRTFSSFLKRQQNVDREERGALSQYLPRDVGKGCTTGSRRYVWELCGAHFRGSEGRPGGSPQDQRRASITLICTGMLFEALIPVFRTRRWATTSEFLIKTLQGPVEFKGPLLLHVITEREKDSCLRPRHSTRCHGVSSFRQGAGRQREEKKNARPSYKPRFSATPCPLGRENPKIVGITAADAGRDRAQAFGEAYPERFFDVGIAEQHAITFAPGLADAGDDSRSGDILDVVSSAPSTGGSRRSVSRAFP